MFKRNFLNVLVYVFCVCSFVGMSSVPSFASPARDIIETARLEAPGVQALSGALAHYMMGTLYDNFSDITSAIGEYKRSLGYNDGIVDTYQRLGADLLLLRKFDEATKVLTTASEMEPKRVKTYLLLAVVHIAKGEFQRAEIWYDRALKQDPENLETLSFISDFLVSQQKYDEAARLYEKILRLKGADASLYFNLGILYSKRNLLDKAEENLEKAVSTDRNYLEAQMVLGYIYEIEGKWDEAIRQYRETISLDPLNKETYVRLGQLYYRTGRTDKAIEQNRVLMKLDPESSEPYLRTFAIYVSGKKYDKAEKILTEAISNEIPDAAVYASLGYLSSLKKDFDAAAENYTIAVKIDPENDFYKFYLAAATDQGGQRKKAIRILRGLVAKKTDLAGVYNYLGYMYVEEDRNLDKAIELIMQALYRDPENGAYMDSLGWAYYKKGMLDDAIKQIEAAVEVLPDNAVVWEHFGDVQSAKGNIEKATKYWEISLELDPENEEVRKKLKKDQGRDSR